MEENQPMRRRRRRSEAPFAFLPNRKAAATAVSMFLLLLPLPLDGQQHQYQQGHEQQRQQQEEEAPADHYSALRNHLLDGYDRFSFPFGLVQEFVAAEGVTRGLSVEVGINFHKVRGVDVVSASADLNVWFRLYWVDPRLAWDPSRWGNVTSANFWIADGTGSGESSEIWAPRLYLWNAHEPLARTLDDAGAIVTPDGRVSWSRPGNLAVACRFGGLEAFPFDDLSCDVEVGTWTFTGKYVYPVVDSQGGHSLGGSETAGQTFAEFELRGVSARGHIYPPYPTAPDEPWPVILYTLRFARAWQPYARGYVVFQVLVTLVGFCCLWVPPPAGERLGLGITAMLASIAGELVVSGRVPPSADWTWYAAFSVASAIFSAAVVFESTIVLYLHYYTGSSLVPSWWGPSTGAAGGPAVGTEEGTRKVAGEGTEEVAGESDGGVDEVGPPEGDSGADGLRRMHLRRQDARRAFDMGRAFDAEDFKTHEEKENNARWQGIARRVDELCRVFLPAAYTASLAAFMAKAGPR